MRKLMTTLLTGFMILSNFAFAKETETIDPSAVKITGIIQDDYDKTPIPYATVVLFNKSDSAIVQGTSADENGNFELSKIPEGDYYIEINFIGYDKKVIKDLKIDKNTRSLKLGVIQVSRAVEDIEGVEIYGEKDAIEYKLDKKVINVGKKDVAAGGTIVDALENTPSIQVDAEGNVSLRGSSNFTVLIDGKPTALNGNDALKGIPASSVENVEIITNPSVKYDPDGTAGILNIIMKKGYTTGVNGILNASVGSRWKYNGDFTFNYRTDKVNYFIGGSYNDRPQYPNTLIDAETFLNDTTSFLIQDADRIQRMKRWDIKGGADFYLNDNNTLTLSGEYGFWGFDLEMDSEVEEYTNPASSDVYKNTVSNLMIGGNWINGSIIFDHDFKENHDLVTTFTYSTWSGTNTSDIEEKNTDELFMNPETYFHTNSSRNDNNQDLRFKTDYTQPIGVQSKLEAGLQVRHFMLDSDYSIERLDSETGLWAEDEEFRNEMDFLRIISSAYATFSSNYKGIQYQIGLRGEYTDRQLDVINTNDSYELTRFDYFPSVHISKQMQKMQQIQASYSRRINRPQPWNLNPFPVFSDSYILQGGNPDLLPEYTDSYELNYMKRLKKGFFSLEGFYRQTNNNYDMNLNLMDDGRVQIITTNLDKSFAYGGELSGNYQFTKWLSVYASANLYGYNIEGDIVTEFADVKSFKSDFVLNSTFTITPTTRLQLTGFYNAPTITSQGLRSEMYGFNAGLTQSFFKRKLSVTLRGRDILNTMKFSFKAESPGVKTDFEFDIESPVIFLNISYKINNYKQRQSDPDTGSEIGGGGIL